MADDAWLAVEQRYGVVVPQLLLRLHADGCCDPHHGAFIQLSDLEWLSPAQICDWRPPADQIAGLLPFASTTNRDLWCLHRDWGDDRAPLPVVFCPEEDEVAHLFAPDVTGFCYRILLEEYACTCLTEHFDVPRSRATLDAYAVAMAAYLPETWAACLRDLAQRPLVGDDNDYFGTLDEDELAHIIARDLAYSRLDEEFEHYLGN